MQININGKICEANEGDYVLQVARANDIFIPAICYLNGCSPTLACRMCMVEIDGKRAYACNTKVKDGMQVLSNTKELWDERNAIMQTYCVNHPLQCGVCDKSGECELQNFTRWAKVDEQRHWVKEIDRRHQDWGILQYDPSLCIVCERCITVCKDKIGDSALKTTARGGDQPDKSFKDTMGKDSYAVWTKFQKSLIAPAAGDKLDCQECAECVSVCPTGALINKSFQYKSNAWELKRIPASNPHSSDCELLYYDIKHKSIKDNSKMIYRVSNDFHFAALSKAARFAYDIDTPNKGKDQAEFNRLVSLFKEQKIKNIKFNSFITNEEAHILQLIANKFGAKLINDEARFFQIFLHEFTKAGGKLISTSADIKQSDFLICAGTLLRNDAAVLSYVVNNAIVMNKGAGIFAHEIVDLKMSSWSKNFISLATCDNETLLKFILQQFGELEDSEYKELLDEYEEVEKITEKKSKDEEGNEIIEKSSEMIKKSLLAKKLGLDEDKLKDLLLKKQNFSLIIGPDFYYCDNSTELAKLSAAVQRLTKFKVFILPTNTNSLGVALINKLSASDGGYCLGYNERADFSFSNGSSSNLAASTLLQQEGSFTNYDLRLVPTNAALMYEGYFLNDLANALGIEATYTIDYTKQLNQDAGFKGIEFDELENFYDNDGSNHRGYELDLEKASQTLANIKVDDTKLANKSLDNEARIYMANPVGNPSKYSNRSSYFNEPACLYVSDKFLKEHNLEAGSMVKLFNQSDEIIIKTCLDKNIASGAYLPSNDEKINPFKLFTSARFASLGIKEIK